MKKPIILKYHNRMFMQHVKVIITDDLDYIGKHLKITDSVLNEVRKTMGCVFEQKCNDDIVVWMKFWAPMILAHESLHIAVAILSRADIKLHDAPEELLAYLIGDITNELSKQYEK